jgi:hypothetical protein
LLLLSARIQDARGLDQRLYLWRRRLGGAERTTFQERVVRPPALRSVAEAEGSAFEIVLASGNVFARRRPSMVLP